MIVAVSVSIAHIGFTWFYRVVVAVVTFVRERLNFVVVLVGGCEPIFVINVRGVIVFVRVPLLGVVSIVNAVTC